MLFKIYLQYVFTLEHLQLSPKYLASIFMVQILLFLQVNEIH